MPLTEAEWVQLGALRPKNLAGAFIVTSYLDLKGWQFYNIKPVSSYHFKRPFVRRGKVLNRLGAISRTEKALDIEGFGWSSLSDWVDYPDKSDWPEQVPSDSDSDPKNGGDDENEEE